MIRLLLAMALVQCPDGTPPPCRGARAVGSAPPSSVAVLSFENRSRDSADAFLGDGLADEIASQLGGVERLIVRSRTVVRRLRNVESLGVPELGRALSAAYLVNGSVQRIGTQLRVQVELLRASSGEQAWAQRYDRTASDLFQIQSEIAQSVSEAIAGRLRPAERATLTRVPTRNPEAYQLYLRAQSVVAGPGTPTGFDAVAALERAVSLDSSFLEAWALLSRHRMWRYWIEADRSPANRAAALGAAEQARRLGPDRVESRLAMGYYLYWGSRDYARALLELNAALRLRPQDAATWDAIANLSRRQGRWEESIAQRRRATSLDPGQTGYWVELANSYSWTRRLPEALASIDSAQAHGGEEVYLESMRATIKWQHGGPEPARPHMRRHVELTGTTVAYYITPDLVRYDSTLWPWVDRLNHAANMPDHITLLGLKRYRWLGAHDSARVFLYTDSLRRLMEREPVSDTAGTETERRLAYLYALLGRHREADSLSTKAIRLMPMSRDAFSGTLALNARALVLALAGRKDEAVDILERLLASPGSITRGRLRTDEGWAVLRGFPRFDRLVAER